MNLHRFIRSIRFCLFFDQMSRANYARKKKIFYKVGENVRLPMMLVPLHAEMIAFHDNIEIASGVKFVVHDAIHGVFNFKYHGKKETTEFPEYFDCIEIMDNVFIGSGTTILAGVRIGPDAIVGANSLVNCNVPEGTIYAGSPAKKIGSFYELVQKRKNITPFSSIEDIWHRFIQKHN
ncbi:2,3,4,5-tetrahydropyridine-2,6-dicarboxylate N-acetyltransferase [bioreactor metagenome]|uniref:2,3,4,5-tetrahydropyridine-2,6-dicarboxylate N-acetyltransferase n=1 Tax=bioreactor metagenome TaxID=1076179 RepID=A0A644TUV0_9ZZZZ